MQLRDYQSTFIGDIRTAYRSGVRSVLGVAPTGAGKSAMTEYMIGESDMLTLILVHRDSLLEMICDSLPVPFDVIGQRGPLRHRVHVGMMQTVSRRLADLPRYRWVISDEAHLAMCETWLRILRHFADAWHLGLSATPCRLDGIGLGGQYQRIIYGPSVRSLTERGFLAPARVFAPPLPGKITRRGKGDNLTQAAGELDQAHIHGDAVDHYRRLAAGRLAMGFCCSRQHAEHVAGAFTMAGIPARHIDGAMPQHEQRMILRAFRAREFPVLFNVDLLTTGFDFPALEAGIFLRPTQSLALILQMAGRFLRIHPGKRDAVLVDHVGNFVAHGLPDADREWTLDGTPQRNASTAISQCSKCHAVYRPAPSCPSCGHVEPAKPKPRQIQTRAGQLEELSGDDPAEARKRWLAVALKDARGKASDMEARTALHLIADRMQYKPGWVVMQMELRRKLRLGAGMREKRGVAA